MTTWTRAASLFTCLGVAACAANATAPVCPPAAPRAVASLPSASAAPADSAAPVASSAPVAPPSASAPPAPPTAVPSSPAEPPKPKRNPYAEGSVYYTEGMFKFNLRLTLGKQCDEAAYLAFECKQPG
ncbi:MAG: hypothetical protein KC492_46465, partial [Myxococcales bacterium]|nr:hypothetical protein [Myxococcales bacterium]